MTLHGLSEIATYLRRSPSTAHRWIQNYGLPACKSPAGTYMVTTEMLAQWMIDLRTVQQQAGEIPTCQRKP